MYSSSSTVASEAEATRQDAVVGRYARAGLVAGVAAAAANTGIAGLVRLFDVTLEAKGKQFPSLAFAQVTLFAAILGVGLAAGLVRRARTPRHTFIVTTVGLTVLSLVPPVLIGASAATVVVLEIMHIVAALVVIPPIAERLAD